MLSKISSFSGPSSTLFGRRSTGFTLVQGNKLPTFGATGQSPFPATGWTSLVSVSADDTFTTVNIPFTFVYNNTNYTTYYPNSNTYITFGAGSTLYNSLSATSPANNKIYIAAKDNSWQRVSSTQSTSFHRLRWEGTSTTTGVVGNPNMVYELTLFNPTFTGGVPWIELLVGTQASGTNSVSVISGLYSTSAKLTGGDLGPYPNRGVSPLTSYVMIGNTAGTSWTVYTGYYVGGTNY
jgi:hypothetical protein